MAKSSNAEAVFGCLAVTLVGVLIVAIVAIKAAGGLNIEYSSGSRSGQVQKISQKGMIWKTWEGEMNLGYMESVKDSEGHSSMQPAIFYFSVVEPKAVEAVKAAEVDGKRVTLNYKQYLFRGFDKGKTSYDVTSVETKPTK